jgi:hypothetical protein
MITNTLFLKLTDRSPETIEPVKAALLGIKGKVPTLVEARVEEEVRSGEADYHLSFITTFRSLEDMQLYLEHAAHREAVTAIKESLTAAASLCYKSQTNILKGGEQWKL